MNYSKENNERKRDARKSNGKKVRNKTLIIAFRVILAIFLIGCFALAGTLFGAYMGIIEKAPYLSTMVVQPNIYSSKIYLDGTEQEIDTYVGSENREYVAFDQIPQYLKDAVVAIEDERFYTHNGVDFRGIARAVVVNLTSSSKEGASTITQQLIKNTVLKVNRNSLETKLQEQYLAVQFEKALREELGSKEAAKNHILEVYLNAIGLHYNLNGVQTAANYYFNKDVSELTLSESAVIAGITQHPTKYEPIKHAAENKERQTRILDKMLEQGYITQEEHDTAMADDVYARISGSNRIVKETGTIHSYYSDAIFEQVSEDLQNKFSLTVKEANNMIYNDGLKIYTPMDPKIQTIVDTAFENDDLFPKEDYALDVTYIISLHNSLLDKDETTERRTTVGSTDEADAFCKAVREELEDNNHTFLDDNKIYTPQPQAAFVIMDYTNGYVKAIGGGRGEKTMNRAFNRATQATRSPGSVFKVLASFAPALDSGAITPGTIIDDVPFSVSGYNPRNHWGSNYKGLMTIREAIRQSANVVTVKNMYQTGIDTCFNYLLQFGFTTLTNGVDENGNTDRVLSTALGGLTHGVKQTEVAAAYGTIANLGYRNPAKFYTVVLNHKGEVLLDNRDAAPIQVLSEGNAYILTDMMRDVVSNREGTGQRARFKNSDMPVSGKTGTTTETVDLTFVGYTPYYVASVWLGNDNSKPMNLRNQGYHLELWRTIMEQVHEGLEVKEFPKPNNIVSVSICKDSGLLPTDLCRNDPRGSQVVTELFVDGTQPTTYCDVHATERICTVSNKIANQYCPDDVVVTRSGIIRKVPYTGTAFVADRAYEIGGALCDVHGEHTVIDATPTEPTIDDTTNPTATTTEEPYFPPIGNTETPIQTETPVPSVAPPATTTEPPTLPPYNENDQNSQDPVID